MINSTCEKLIDAISQSNIIKVNEIIDNNTDDKFLVNFYKMTQDEHLVLELIKLPRIQKNLAVYFSNQEMLILAHNKNHKQLSKFIINYSISEYKRKNRLFLYFPHIILLMMGYLRSDGQYREKSNNKIELLVPLLEAGVDIRIPPSQMSVNIKMFEKTFSSIEFLNFSFFNAEERTFLGGLTYLAFSSRSDLTHLVNYTKNIEGVDKIIYTMVEQSFKFGSRHLLQDCNSLQLKERFRFLMNLCPQFSQEDYLKLLRGINHNYRHDLLEHEVREKILTIYNTIVGLALKKYPDMSLDSLTAMSEHSHDESVCLSELMVLGTHAAHQPADFIYEKTRCIMTSLIRHHELLAPARHEPSTYLEQSFEIIHKISLMLGAPYRQKMFDDAIDSLRQSDRPHLYEAQGILFEFLKKSIDFGVSDISSTKALPDNCQKLVTHIENLQEYILFNGAISCEAIDYDFKYKV